MDEELRDITEGMTEQEIKAMIQRLEQDLTILKWLLFMASQSGRQCQAQPQLSAGLWRGRRTFLN
jgi:hypothetical protein